MTGDAQWSAMSYIKYRCRELPIWLGIPLIGFFFTGEKVISRDFVVFLIASAFFMAHILLLNDWGGIVRNPGEGKRYNQNYSSEDITKSLLFSSFVSFVMSLLLFSAIKIDLGVLTVVGACLSFLYSAPSIHWKEAPILSKCLHLGGGIIKFLMGYLVNESHIGRGTLIGLFFSVLFMAGNFIHECIDEQVDRNGSLKTAAVRWGTRPLTRISWYVFLFAHVYWLVLTVLGIITLVDAGIFSVPLIVHLLARTAMGCAQCDLLKYRSIYRTAYALSAGIFIVKQILY